jgi:hypothetical protein
MEVLGHFEKGISPPLSNSWRYHHSTKSPGETRSFARATRFKGGKYTVKFIHAGKSSVYIARTGMFILPFSWKHQKTTKTELNRDDGETRK